MLSFWFLNKLSLPLDQMIERWGGGGILSWSVCISVWLKVCQFFHLQTLTPPISFELCNIFIFSIHIPWARPFKMIPSMDFASLIPDDTNRCMVFQKLLPFSTTLHIHLAKMLVKCHLLLFFYSHVFILLSVQMKDVKKFWW